MQKIESYGKSTDTISCFTLVDISQTGTTRPYKKESQSYVDHTGQQVIDFATWTISRNRQRNWETLLQTISLRAQPDNLQVVQQTKTDLINYKFGDQYHGIHTIWSFKFSVEYPQVFDKNHIRLGALMDDTDHVPCILGLSETAKLPQALFLTHGPHLNTYFEIE